jgi:hypothetical protein
MRLLISNPFASRATMTPSAPRRHIKLAAALVIVVAALSAVLYVYSEKGIPGATLSPATDSTTAASCYSTNDLANSFHYAFTISVNYTGQWNATAVGYSEENNSVATTPYFVDCFTGSGVGLIHFSDWNPGAQATLQVVAQKTDAGDGNLTIAMTYGSANSLTITNSTTLPHGSATVTGTMVGSTAVASSPPTSTSTAGTQLYDVTFQQVGDCSPPEYVAPWSVTLGNETIAQPSNATLPATGGFSTDPAFSTIVFSVPEGIYQYSISPTGEFSASSGVVTVDGLGVTVMVYGPAIGCVTTTG